MGSNSISFERLASGLLQEPAQAKASSAKEKEEERSSSRPSRASSSSHPTFKVDSRAVTFQVDSKSGETYITVLDPETGEVIREIPPEELRELAEKLQQATGSVVDVLG